MLYCAVGIPIMLVTVADIAKFMSELLVKFYISYRKWKFKNACQHGEREPLRNSFKKRKKDDRTKSIVNALAQHAENLASGLPLWTETIPKEATDEQIAELIWENLETTEFVEVPAPVVLGIVGAYSVIGAMLFRFTEGWGGLDSLYFAVTSLLKVGFGDFTPKSPWLPVAIAYLLFGLVISTMGVDLIGVRYLSRLHQFGRRVEETDYLGWLIAIQMRRKKRAAMKALLDILYQTTMPFMKAPPDPPSNLRVADTTAHSVLLTWDPSPTATLELVSYGIHFRPKGRQEQARRRIFTMSPSTPPGDVRDIAGTSYEVKGLRSFTLYEFQLYAQRHMGMGSRQSERVLILHYTEPESVPQRLKAQVIDHKTVEIMWCPPLRNREGRKMQYTIFYTAKPNEPFERWQKVPLGDTNTAVLRNLQPGTHYCFCVSAGHNLGMAMVSRTIAVRTLDKQRKYSAVEPNWNAARKGLLLRHSASDSNLNSTKSTSEL